MASEIVQKMKEYIGPTSGLVALAIACYTLFLTKEIKTDIASIKHRQETFDSASVAVEYLDAKIQRMQSRLDSAKQIERQLAKSIIYVDSVQVSRQAKADRAERRGKFVGGLLKALIPSL